MPSSRRHRGRRAALAVAAVALLAVAGPSGSTAVGAEDTSGPAPQYALPAGLPALSAREPDAADPALHAMALWDRDVERHALDQVGGHPTPFLTSPLPGTSDVRALVVPKQGSPYDLAEVARMVPSAFERLDDGALLLRHTLVVGQGAELVVDSATVPALLLSSSPTDYVSIRVFRSTLRLVGRAGTRLTVGSLDPATGRRDDDRHDGRAYLLARGSHLDVRHATLSDLGFPTIGETSGVAWTAATDRPATGGASDSTFRRNYFGAYTAGAQGLVIARSAFLDNVVYGFDPHTATNDTLVTESVAARNGRHGFIFSENCDRNVVRDSKAYLNGGTGFMIDDGIPEHGADRASDHNVLLRVSSHDNGDVGIVVEGGTGNTVEQSVVTNNEEGIWVRDRADGTELVGNRVVATQGTAVRLDEHLGETLVVDTEIVGARIGTHSQGGSPTLMRGNATRGTTAVGLRLEGDQSRARLEDLQVVVDTGRVVDVRGTGLSPAALAAIDTGPGAPFWATWTLVAALHTSIVSLWSAILVLPITARLLLGARRLVRSRRRPTPAPA